MRKPILILAVLALVAAGAAYWLWGGKAATYPITNERGPGRGIVAFGDSLTAGNGAGPGESYPEQLAKLLGATVVNAGHSGDTTEAALARVDRDVLGSDPPPRVVIVFLGGNDILRNVPRTEFVANLESIVRRIQARGCLVVLVGIRSGLMNAYYSTEYRELARKTGCPLVPNVLDGIMGDPALMSDQIHPNGRGYARMTGRIAEVVRRYIVPAPAGG